MVTLELITVFTEVRKGYKYQRLYIIYHFLGEMIFLHYMINTVKRGMFFKKSFDDGVINGNISNSAFYCIDHTSYTIQYIYCILEFKI